MKKKILGITGVVGVLCVSVVGLGIMFPGSAVAQTDGEMIIKDRDLTMVARLDGYQEVPAISTKAHGAFKARLIRGGKAVEYALAYSNLEGRVTQAHIHFGRTGTNGGIMVFLCQSGINQDPASRAPLCPQEGSVEGVITEDNILGPAGQGIEPGAYREFLQVVLARAAYVNVHSTKFLTGEIRGQIGTTQLAVDVSK
jgi:hypothetical protein